jgi:hypothetical protein
MAIGRIRARLTISNMLLAVAVFSLLLVAFHSRASHERAGLLASLQILDPADHTVARMEAHARRLRSPAVVAAALADHRVRRGRWLLGVSPLGPEPPRLVVDDVRSSADSGTICMSAEADSNDEATTFLRAIADAYAEQVGPGRVGDCIMDHHGEWSVPPPVRPWKVIVATLLSALASGSMLLVPLSWRWPSPMRHPRFRLRTLLILVAVVAVAIGAKVMRRRRAKFRSIAETCIWAEELSRGLASSAPDKAAEDRYGRLSAHWAAQGRKCEHAARYPWLPVAPDPPPPR